MKPIFEREAHSHSKHRDYWSSYVEIYRRNFDIMQAESFFSSKSYRQQLHFDCWRVPLTIASGPVGLQNRFQRQGWRAAFLRL